MCFSAGQTEGQTSPGQIVDEPIHPVNIPRREKDFQGMLEYKKEDEMKLVKNLILGKKWLVMASNGRFSRAIKAVKGSLGVFLPSLLHKHF